MPKLISSHEENLALSVANGSIAAQAEETLRKLVAYCQENNWAGYDPYDALNSRILKKLPFLDRRLPRLALTQALKRSPVNLRPLMLVPPAQNPKAIGLFLAAFVKLSAFGTKSWDSLIPYMIDRLVDLRSPNLSYWCWGYSFPWQARLMTDPVAKGAPNLVCTTFVADALLDAYVHTREARCLEMAAGAADYILNELYWTKENSPVAGFAYPLPSVRSNTYNANFLAAALLCRVSHYTGDDKFLNPALKAARFSAAQQNEDGSWYYGEAPSQKWIDNFHTGYNLCALRGIARYAGITEFEACVQRGFEFYRHHFFCADGAAKYYHDRTYPIDTHCVAQSILTLLAFKDLDAGNVELVNSIFRWTIKNMWDVRGFFYYRVLRLFTVRASYMRWSQAWMLLAIATLVCDGAGSSCTKQASAVELGGVPLPTGNQCEPVRIAP